MNVMSVCIKYTTNQCSQPKTRWIDLPQPDIDALLDSLGIEYAYQWQIVDYVLNQNVALQNIDALNEAYKAFRKMQGDD